MPARTCRQLACAAPDAPSAAECARWVAAAAPDTGREVTVRVVDEAESRALNRAWRGRDRATNVLSFPAGEPPAAVPDAPLGDLVICAPVVAREAAGQRKPLRDHWAHLVVHGVLHLLGHDHEREADAALMEACEVRLLAGFGIPDPYRVAPAACEPLQRAVC